MPDTKNQKELKDTECDQSGVLRDGFYGLEWQRGERAPNADSEKRNFLVVIKAGNERRLVVAHHYFGETSSGFYNEWWVDDLWTGEGFMAISNEVLYWAELPTRPKMRALSNSADSNSPDQSPKQPESEKSEL